MDTQHLFLLIINIIGGILVIGSYIWGIKSGGGSASSLWGGVPENIRWLYAVSMLLSAVGYFLFTLFILFKVDSSIKIWNFSGFNLFYLSYLLILIPSSFWMPLTTAYVGGHSAIIWIAIRVVLFLVAAGSFLLLLSLLNLNPKPSGLFYTSAIAGITVFFLHTFVLDAILWPSFFNK